MVIRAKAEIWGGGDNLTFEAHRKENMIIRRRLYSAQGEAVKAMRAAKKASKKKWIMDQGRQEIRDAGFGPFGAMNVGDQRLVTVGRGSLRKGERVYKPLHESISQKVPTAGHYNPRSAMEQNKNLMETSRGQARGYYGPKSTAVNQSRLNYDMKQRKPIYEWRSPVHQAHRNSDLL